MSIKTIDDRLRANAAEALRLEINTATLTLTKLIREADYPRGDFGTEKSMPLHVAMGVVEKALHAALKDHRADAAIKAFMQRVDSLQEQLDELRGISHEH